MKKILLFLIFTVTAIGKEPLTLDVISYDAFVQEDPQTIATLKKAFHEKGIVGMRGIPGYQEKVQKYIHALREFSALPEEVKRTYAPKEGEMFLGYERGKEKFQRPDGKWVIDDLKVSYYTHVPNTIHNKWPKEVDLFGPYMEMGELMSEVGTAVLDKMGVIGLKTGIDISGVPRVGRMLYYAKSSNTQDENPYWCGAHFDHGMFTVLIPASYYAEGKEISEPSEAGLFVRPRNGTEFQKVCANDPDVMLFQVGEFGQLITNDALQATEHRVQKAHGDVERFTMALFFGASMDTVVCSESSLTADSRYGGTPGEPCSYLQWTERTFERYIVRDESD